MSLVASDRAPLGVAQILCLLTPLFLIPCMAPLYKERISPRAVIGALAAVGGVAVLFIRRG
jgi:drug/metabolite transporter (DMT)-like permease